MKNKNSSEYENTINKPLVKTFLFFMALSIIFVILSLTACGLETLGRGKIVKQYNVGIVRDVNIVPTSFNETVKTEIKCDSLYIVIRKIITIKLGSEAFIREYENKDKYFVVDNFSYRIN